MRANLTLHNDKPQKMAATRGTRNNVLSDFEVMSGENSDSESSVDDSDADKDYEPSDSDENVENQQVCKYFYKCGLSFSCTLILHRRRRLVCVACNTIPFSILGALKSFRSRR